MNNVLKHSKAKVIEISLVLNKKRFLELNFNDLIIDISLFRPGPIKSDMITPFLEVRQNRKPLCCEAFRCIFKDDKIHKSQVHAMVINIHP